MVGALFAPPKRSGTPRKHFDKGSPDATLVCYASTLGGPARERWCHDVAWMENVGATLEKMRRSQHIKLLYVVRVYAKRK